MNGTDPETITADTPEATRSGETAPPKDRLRAINYALAAEVLPGVYALRALTEGEWEGPQQVDAMQRAVEWIADRLESDISRVIEMADAALDPGRPTSAGAAA